ncbi:MAG TPA: flavin reductase family protein [Edaphocola sp.]|nr:flavin reductase family protein [Edaphocola sp.]
MDVIPGQISTKQFHAYMLGSIAPRPICFASTIDKEGNVNLSPFSFFNAFGSNPATIVFSPARRVRDNTTKHTLENILETMEVVINVVSYDMVQQTSLSSCEYPQEVNEFVKAGFTPIASDLVKPFRVKESPVSMECKVVEVKAMGDQGGAANLIICEVLKMHINDAILDADQQIDPHKIDLVARMGFDYYCRASGAAVFEVAKPNHHLGLGFDNLPEKILKSKILSGNDLGILANYTTIPQAISVDDHQLTNLLTDFENDEEQKIAALHEYAKKLIKNGDVALAWQVLLAGME